MRTRKPPTTQPTVWMTPKEAAEYLRIHIDSIYDACKKKGLRHSKFGYKSIRIKRQWLDDWAETYVHDEGRK